MIISRQDQCFECSYSLEGLPRPYRCPECALAFDDDSVVFRPKRIWKRILPIVVSQLYLLYLAANHWAWLVAKIGLLAAIVSLVLLAAYVLVRSVTMFRSMIERPGFVALTKDDLVVRQHNQAGLTRIPYDQIAFVSVVDCTPWVQSKEIGVDEATRKATPRGAQMAGLFDGQAELLAFKTMVTERMERERIGDHADSKAGGAPIATVNR